MYKLIAGKEGCGKTKKIIDMANEQLKNSNGSVVFIDDNKHHMYDLKHDLRFISMDEFPVKTSDEFFGFLCGLISNNYDIQTVYIDGIQKMTNLSFDEFTNFVKKTDAMASKYDIDFVYTLNHDTEKLPDDMTGSLV